ncbi:unnamed protein product [Ilex paraguariensis]|uniref:Annexin n=1 Tax=Ilex paraguariensis TaxID=185542 RepID=A0ABC8U8L3_9AQUA
MHAITFRRIHVIFNWFQRAVLLWMHDPAGRDATIVRQALSGSIIDLKVATEVICSRTSSQIQHFKQVYHAMFGVYLEQDIEFQASADHKKHDKSRIAKCFLGGAPLSVIETMPGERNDEKLS